MAGLVAFGVSDGGSALADDAVAPSATTVPAAPAKAPRRTSAKKGVKASKAVAGLVATLPGFEMLPDGGSRVFVELTHTANVVEKRDARMITYVIQGARVALRNNENALVTVHFNTPVTRARLLPVRNDVVFSVELRADAVPVWRMVDGGDGTSTLQVDFPKGAFLPAGEEVVNQADEALPRPAGADDPPLQNGLERGHRGRRGSVRPPAPPPPGPPGPPSGT